MKRYMCLLWVDEVIFLQMKVTQKEPLRAWPCHPTVRMNGCGGVHLEATWEATGTSMHEWLWGVHLGGHLGDVVPLGCL